MENLISSVVLAVSFYAFGIFYLLSFLEKRIWGIMQDALTSTARDEDILEINQTLQSIVNYVPLTMKVIMASLLLLLSAQLWLSSFAPIPTIQIIILVSAASLGIKQVLSSIGELKESEIQQRSMDEVRKETAKVLIVHHAGLFVALLVGILQVLYLV